MDLAASARLGSDVSLVAATLASGLDFGTHGATAALCAQQWASAFGSYAGDIVPSSLNVAAAQASLQSALTTAFASTSAVSQIDAAFAAAAATIAAGMAPAFTGTPPVAPLNLATALAQPYPSTHSAAQTKVATHIDTWMKTGMATPTAGGPPVNWS